MQKAKLIIGCDIDDTLTPWTQSFLEHHNKKYGTKHEVEHMTKFGLSEFLGLPREETRKRMFQFAKSELSNLVPYEEALRGIDFIHREGHELYAISSRGDIFQDVTENWMRKHFQNKFSGIYLTNEASPTGPKKSKAEVMGMFNIDVHIDDNLENAKKITERGYSVILLEQPWNIHKKIDPVYFSAERIYRAPSWFGIVGKITELSCEKFRDITHR